MSAGEDGRKNNSNNNEIYTFPTMKFRSFTNAFCPCCLDQKQRDCANYVQVNLTNALKASQHIECYEVM